jgi:hypothetical protein
MDDVGAISVLVSGQTFLSLTGVGTTVAITVLLLARNWRLALLIFAWRLYSRSSSVTS